MEWAYETEALAEALVGLRVLLIGERAWEAEALLRQRGVAVECAESSEDGYRRFGDSEAGQYQVIVLDRQWLELTERLRQCVYGERVPIIVIGDGKKGRVGYGEEVDMYARSIEAEAVLWCLRGE